MSLRKVELVISGVVLGVGFRYFVYHTARQLGVVGWVRNLPDGSVQVTAEGENGLLGSFIEELKVGPRMASISDVAVKWSDATGEYRSFEVQ
ncbi:MAG: acylphosphatase [candidate division Zixibacteria bacterium]|nr:acylphosphatase [candidate division Zixibacteria bacterium]